MKLRQQLAATAATALLVLLSITPAFAEESPTDEPAAQTEGGGETGSENQDASPNETADVPGEPVVPSEAADLEDGSVTGDAEHQDPPLDAPAVPAEALTPAGETSSAPLALGLADGAVNVRLQGADRYATAVEVSRQAYPNASGGTVIIATGTDFPDSLSAAALAAKRSAPLLLTVPDGIPDITLAEVNRLKPRTILVIGSAAAVSDAVYQQLTALRWPGIIPQVRRIAGADRFETSAAIAREGWGNSISNAFVATGLSYADALSAGAAASRINGPVLLVPGASAVAPASITSVLAQNARLYIAGSNAAVSDAMVASLAARTGHAPVRYAGADRYETSALIAHAHFSTSVGSSFWATGQGFADALAGAAVAGAASAPLLLVLPSCIPSAIYDANDRLRPGTTYLLGSTTALSDAVLHGNECAGVRPSGMSDDDATGSSAVYAAFNAERYQRGLQGARLADSAKGQPAFAWSASMSGSSTQPARLNSAIGTQVPWVRLEYVVKNPTVSHADSGAAFAHMRRATGGQSLLNYQPAGQRVLVSIGWIDRQGVSFLTVYAGI